ncbi:MAG: right-handed parallel beta-helix repeat-containing protein [Candidatus Thorarchaeota archaeon]|jgi:parallel beta-helix repeat protein
MEQRRRFGKETLAVSLVLVIWTTMFTGTPLIPIERYSSTTPNVPQWNPRTQQVKVSLSYTPRGRININGDSSFDSQASANGWNVNGNGQTLETAYVIQDYEIVDSVFPLIEIRSTSRYFTIKDCHLDGVDGGDDAILLFDCTNAVSVETNIIERIRHGVYLRNSDGVTIWNNTVDTASESALRIAANYINITQNKLSNADWNTIWLETSLYSSITYNRISGTLGNGIFFDGRGTIAEIGALGKLTPGPINYNNVSFNHITGVETGAMLFRRHYSVSHNTISSNNITGVVCDGFEIRGAAVENTIADNTIEKSGENGVFLWNSFSCTFVNNTIRQNTKSGIQFREGPYDATFINNTIEDNMEHGVHIDDTNGPYELQAYFAGNEIRNNAFNGVYIASDTSGVDIINNVIEQNTQSGIAASFSGDSAADIVCSENTIFDNDLHGIVLSTGVQGYDITQNTIRDNSLYGIYLGIGSYEIDIISNDIYNSSIGIVIEDSFTNSISLNTVFGCSKAIEIRDSSRHNNFLYNRITDPLGVNHNDQGILIAASSYSNTFQNNTILGHSDYGLLCDSSTLNNIVQFNAFIDNRIGFNQGYDNGTTNTFLMNYWNDWTTPDANFDGFVDSPYVLDGIITNSDPLPLTDPPITEGSDFILNFELLAPDGDELINATTLISWAGGVDTEGHSLNYTIYYSSNGGVDWILVAEGLTDTSYLWTTTELARGSNYYIRVNVTCTEGVTSEDISNQAFTLNPHSLGIPVVTSPNGGEEVPGSTRITWTVSLDSWLSPVNYSVYFSNNSGIDWFEIVTGLSVSFYDWNATAQNPGTQHLIRVVASSEYSSSMDDSDAVFTLLEHTMSIPTIQYPTAGAVVSGVAVVVWEPVVESWLHEVYYNVSFSDDDGVTWSPVSWNTTTTLLILNVTDFPVGSEYRIRVVANCEFGLATVSISDAFTILSESNIVTTTTVTMTTTFTNTTTPSLFDDPLFLLLFVSAAAIAATVLVLVYARHRMLRNAAETAGTPEPSKGTKPKKASATRKGGKAKKGSAKKKPASKKKK